MSATPAAATLTPGSTGQAISVTATAVNGFTSAVPVAITGLPAGVTANPSTLTLTPGTAQSVTLTAGASATAGVATVTFTGTSGASSHAATVAVTVSAPPADFSLTLAPTSLSLTSGASGSQVSVTANAVNGFTGQVAVAISGLPAGVTANPATLTLTPGTAQSVTLTAASSAVAGNATVTFAGTSGALSHTATLALTVAAAAPDFSLTATPTSLTLTGGAAGGQISLEANAANGFNGTVAVAITGLTAGVTANPTSLNLTPGTAGNVTLTAATAAAAGTATVTFTGTSGNLSHSATVTLTVQAAAPAAPDVATYHYDNARDGLNAAETILTPANVNATQFGKIGFDAVDGLVDAEPLFAANLTVNGATRNVLFVATEHDSLYAFDADSGTQLWKSSVLGSGETSSDDHTCPQIRPEIGITSTPVIDRKQGPNGTIFLVGTTKDAGGAYHHRLHALDLTTGAEVSGSPTEVSATYPGTGANSQGGNVVFDPRQYAERAALLLVNGTIYTTWTSHCDATPYTGWVISYSETTLKQSQVLNLTPNGGYGAVWMAGDGPASDANGNIYLLDANGTFDLGFDANGFPTQGDFGNGIIKMSLDSTGALKVSDYFEPFNTDAETSADTDLGSGGEILLPDLTDSNGVKRQLIVAAGKDQHIYLGDRNNLGKFNAMTSDNSNLYQDVTGVLNGKIYSTPAYFNGAIYYAGVGDSLRAIPITNAKLASASSSQSTFQFDYPGATPSISANGTKNGIIWALETKETEVTVLHAYDATNLAKELYNSSQAANNRDSFTEDAANKFITPMIVNGKVYVGTPSGVQVFGLLPQ